MRSFERCVRRVGRVVMDGCAGEVRGGSEGVDRQRMGWWADVEAVGDDAGLGGFLVLGCGG